MGRVDTENAAGTDPLERAGKYLMGAGFLAALVAGAYGLYRNDPLTVGLAVVTVIGYGIAGWLLVGIGEEALEPAASLALIFSLLSFWLLGGEIYRFAGSFGRFVLFPTILLLLSYAGGGVVGAAMARSLEEVPWNIEGASSAAWLLHAAAAPAVWSAFLIANVPQHPFPPIAASFAVGVAGLAAVGAATGGRLVELQRHPRYALAASLLILGANGWYLLEFSSIAARVPGSVGPGRVLALVGMLASAFPVVFSAVAWYQVLTQRQVFEEV